jgi:hypothetical protein
MRYLSVALACALAACASGGGNGPPPPPPPPKILLGAHIPWSQNAMTPVTAFETSLGRKLDIVKFYPSWPPWSAWDVSFAKAIVAHGAVPYLVIGQRIGQNGCVKFADVVNGVYQTQLATTASQIADIAKTSTGDATVRVEILPEMTQPDMLCANPTMDPSLYIKVYNIVAGVIRATQAPDVRLEWSPGQPAFDANVEMKWYPSDAYVDDVGEHEYNSTTTPKIFHAAVCAVAASLGKPAVIGETGAIGEAAQLDWLAGSPCSPLAGEIYFDEEAVAPYNYVISTPDVFAAFAKLGN